MDRERLDRILSPKLDTLAFHRSYAGVSPQRYSNSRGRLLGQRMAGIYRIYLDTRYWIHLRDAHLNRARNPDHDVIYNLACQLSAAGRAVFPLSLSSFTELMRQNDLATRFATSEVMQRLSGGVCIRPYHELLGREILSWMRHLLNSADHDGRFTDAWTKISFYVGEMHLKVRTGDVQLDDAIAKSMDDLLWSIGVDELVQFFEEREGGENVEELVGLAEDCNRGKVTAFPSQGAFFDVFISEVAGGLEACTDLLGDIAIHIARNLGQQHPVAGEEKIAMGLLLRNAITNAFQHKKVRFDLPQVHVCASLHAAVRCDKQRKYDRNDFEDFRHAASALGYCNAFFTEGGLCHLLRTSPLKLDTYYGVQVLSDELEIVEHLKGLAKSGGKV